MVSVFEVYEGGGVKQNLDVFLDKHCPKKFLVQKPCVIIQEGQQIKLKGLNCSIRGPFLLNEIVSTHSSSSLCSFYFN